MVNIFGLYYDDAKKIKNKLNKYSYEIWNKFIFNLL